MRSDQEIIGRAALLKGAILSRRDNIMQKSEIIAKAMSGIAHDVKPDRLETLRVEVLSLSEKQERDSLMFATLRWVIGCTEDIEPHNLQLDL